MSSPSQASASLDAVVRVRGLHKSYGTFQAVKGISFDIQRGETFALLGPNGAGKSTTIEILEGYRDRTSGDVSVLGVDPQRGGKSWRARIGIVLQSSGANANASVRELLTEFAGYYPVPRSVDEVITAVGLIECADTRIGKLSGGQQRRVDVALGIIGSPDMLFLDEPTTGFDPAARRHFWELIRGLKAEGTTILLTTHYLDEAAQLADRGAVIAGGTIVGIGPIGELGGSESRRPRVRWREGSVMREERTDAPAARVAELFAAHGAEPQGLEVIRPSLEDVYLDMLTTADASADGAHAASTSATSSKATT